jgi:hypothetical protein
MREKIKREDRQDIKRLCKLYLVVPQIGRGRLVF